jgi:hypothetical protein
MTKPIFFFIIFLVTSSNRLLSQKITDKELLDTWINLNNPTEIWEFKGNDTLLKIYNKETLLEKYALDNTTISNTTILKTISQGKDSYKNYFSVTVKNWNEISLYLIQMFRYITLNNYKYATPRDTGWQEYKLMKIYVTNLKRKRK